MWRHVGTAGVVVRSVCVKCKCFFFSDYLPLLMVFLFCSPNKACDWCAYRKKRRHRTEEKKRRMTDEEDGDDVEDGRRTRRKTEHEREEKEWRARMEQILVWMDTWEKWRMELDEQQVVLGRRLVAGVDWVGELLVGVVELLRRREGEGSDEGQRGGEGDDEEVRGTEGDGEKTENGKEGEDEEMKGD